MSDKDFDEDMSSNAISQGIITANIYNDIGTTSVIPRQHVETDLLNIEKVDSGCNGHQPSSFEFEIDEQEIVINYPDHIYYETIDVDTGVFCIFVRNQHDRKLLNTETVSYKYSDFYYKGMCHMGCKSAPHTDAEIRKIAKVVQKIESYFKYMNLMSNKFLLSIMDRYGWIRTDLMHMLPKIQDINIKYDDFVVALEHSLKVSLSKNKQYVRPNCGVDLFENIKNTQESHIPQLVTMLPKNEMIRCDTFRKFLSIHGCHQRMAKAFNDKIYLLNIENCLACQNTSDSHP